MCYLFDIVRPIRDNKLFQSTVVVFVLKMTPIMLSMQRFNALAVPVPAKKYEHNEMMYGWKRFWVEHIFVWSLRGSNH